MKAVFWLLITAVMILTAVMPVSAEDLRKNPSMYSFAEIVQKLPVMWTEKPDAVTEMMEKYPDFECWRSHEIMGCSSVNNKYSADVNVNFQFSSEEDEAELVRAVYSMEIDKAEDIQELLENFWLPGMAAANISGSRYPEGQIRLYFSSENTLMLFQTPVSEPGKYWYITVDMGIIRG